MAVGVDNDTLRHYQRWERRTGDVPGRYTVALPETPLFALRDADVPMLREGVRLRETDGGVELLIGEGEAAGSAGRIDGMSVSQAREILGSVDGRRSLGEIVGSLEGRYPPDPVRGLLGMLLGRVVLAPVAVAKLEARLPLAEIVRFPLQSPYTVPRAYWENCAEVRSRLSGLYAALSNANAFRERLAELHLIATVGPDQNSYYGGAGSVPTIPGGYRTVRVRTGLVAGRALFVRRFLKERGFGDLLPEGTEVYSPRGLYLGRLDHGSRTCRHPSPEDGHLDALLDELRETLGEARQFSATGDSGAALDRLADFHKLFLHAHPFYNVNNSLAMNIVNDVLRHAGLGYVSHLVLDFIAMRVDLDVYRAVLRHTVEGFALIEGDKHGRETVLARLREFHGALLRAVEESNTDGA